MPTTKKNDLYNIILGQLLSQDEGIDAEILTNSALNAIKFSYVLDSEEYIIKPDHRMNFYKMTGISYQVLELIYELIRINNEKSWDFEIDDKIDWIKHDDKLYSELSKRIMNKMNKMTI